MNATSRIYLDYAATTPIDPEVLHAMSLLYMQELGNAASPHQYGRTAYQIIEQAKNALLGCVDAPRDDMRAAFLVATSGGTEANNLVVRGLTQDKPAAIWHSTIEHPSVSEAASFLAKSGHTVYPLAVDDLGMCRLDILNDQLAEYRCSKGSDHVPLVSIIFGNNEVGVIQDIKSICDLCRRYGALVHADCCQVLGKIPLSMFELGLDALTITAHKLHGPIGIGALIVRAGLAVKPLLFGGGQQLSVRPGTESPVLLAGFARAAELAQKRVCDGVYQSLSGLRDHFEQRLAELVADTMILAKSSHRLPHISNVAFAGVDRQALLMALDFAGIMCSTGSACASGSNRPSPVVTAMNVPKSHVNGSMRFSFFHGSKVGEVDTALDRIVEIVKKIRKSAGSKG